MTRSEILSETDDFLYVLMKKSLHAIPCRKDQGELK